MKNVAMPYKSRNGTILIIVAGVCALLASLALTFLTRMRSDMEESQLLLQYAQAKIMLAAGCNYIQETSRLGWDRYPSSPVSMVDGLPVHDEAFGWIDVRTGDVGPLDKNRQKLPNPSFANDEWPSIGAHARCPMYAMKMPPYATKMDAGFNLMQTSNRGASDYCWPLLRYPDPQPVDQYTNNWTPAGGAAAVTSTNYNDWKIGDPTPQPESVGKSWFRVFRDGPSTFIITCGAGGSYGFKSWAEVVKENKEDLFVNDESYFNSLRQTELRLHYRVEWTAAVTETTYHNLQHEIGRDIDHYETWPPNSSHAWSSSRRTQTWLKNPVGTMRWIQRLLKEPSFW